MSKLHGKNLSKIKQQNLESIRATLYRYAPLSRAEIAEKLELTPPTITNIVSDLIKEGVVQELPESDGAISHGVGRKPINIDLVPGSRLALGISLGRELTHYCITDLRGGIRAQGNFELMPDDYDSMIHQLLEILHTLKGRHMTEWDLLIGIGIAIPGIVNPHTGIVKNHGNERLTWRNQPLGTTISQAVHLPVRVENNVRARACAVSLFRPNLLGTESTFAFCHVAWGIACPIMLGDNSSRSETSTAGEIGKMIIDPNHKNTSSPDYGYPGSLEALSSAGAILASCRQALLDGHCTVLPTLCSSPDHLTLEHILTAQLYGDTAVCKILTQAMEYLGIALANVVSFFNPHLIFLSGSLFRNSENVGIVRNSLYTYAFRSSDEMLRLIHMDLGEYGGAVGAAASCIEKYFLRSN